MLCIGRKNGKAKYYLMDDKWNLLRINSAGIDAPEGYTPPKPEALEKMFEYASILSKPFPFVRVDFYYAGGRIIFGELTFTPCACLDSAYTPEGDLMLGGMLDIGGAKR